MALFPARDRDAFDAHWERLLRDDSLVKRTIVDGVMREASGRSVEQLAEKENELLVGLLSLRARRD